MEELFGLSMNALMIAVLASFLTAAVVLIVTALRGRIILKLGLRPIPRRLGQTALIVIGVMLSTVIISAAFGTGDTISYSIRSEVLEDLGTVDEVIIPARAEADDSFGSNSYADIQWFEDLRVELSGFEEVDGLAPQIAESVPAVNVRTSQSEGFMRVLGVDPAHLDAFGSFMSATGETVDLTSLAGGEVYVNEKAADELDAVVGDEVRLFIGDSTPAFKIREIVEQGGLAGRDPTLIFSLELAQATFGREGQINSIVISNRGDSVEGEEVSKSVARRLRVLYTDRRVAAELQSLLDSEPVLDALAAQEESLANHLKEEVSQLRDELRAEELSDDLVSLLADEDIVGVISDALESGELKEVDREASTLFSELASFRVFELKRRGLAFADEAGSFATTFFMVMSLFSISVGVLLIFLIFVMLASARRSEMGMARAIGARRRHLVQMFTFEGTAYALASAAAGVVLGLAVSAGMVVILNRLFASFEEDFQMTIHFEPRTIIVSYCIGMIITMGTVVVSSYRVSRLNIVTAIRGLPEAIALKSETSFRHRLLLVGRAMVRPLIHLWSAVRALRALRLRRVLGRLGLAVFWAVLWPAGVAVALVRFSWTYILRGWLLLLIGVLVTWWGIAVLERLSVFTAGASLMILGLGLMLRVLALGSRIPVASFGLIVGAGGVVVLVIGIVESSVLTIAIAIVSLVVGAAMAWPFVVGRVEHRTDLVERMAFTFIGVVMLAFWALPSVAFNQTIEDLQGDFDMMFVSGIFMVSAAVWSVMYNADLLIRALTLATSRVGRLRPVFVTAVAYPMSSKFRTGLTLAMFALVIFTLTVMSVLSETFGTQFAETETITGGWDINAQVNASASIEDIRSAIDEHPDLRLDDFEAIGGYTWIGLQARQLEGESRRWEGTGVRAADDAFLSASEYKFKLIADGYGSTADEVWQALMRDPGLAVVGGNMVATSEGSDSGGEFEPWLEQPYYRDETMAPVDIEVREGRTGATVQLKVIAVLDRIHENTGSMVVSKSVLDSAVPFAIPVTNYRFKVAAGIDAEEAATDLEASFLEHGMDTVALEKELEKEAAGGKTFFRMFIGFMSLGLLVGVAGLGVVSTRAVVERRQQIGVLRAIGYRRRMIQLSFLLEASFISLLGIVIGTVLGIVLGWQAYTDIKQDEGIDTIRFGIPWIQIGVILALTYVASLLATFLPARQASRVYPAEALRYE